jgi:hypothetical protein
MINVIIMAVLKDELHGMKTFNYLLISIALFSMFGCNSPQRNQEKNIGNTGVINSNIGRSYLDKKRPLDFKRSRFHFTPVDSK